MPYVLGWILMQTPVLWHWTDWWKTDDGGK